MNSSKLQQYQEFHPLNRNSVTALKEILCSFGERVHLISFLSNVCDPRHIEKDHPIFTEIDQHRQLELLYGSYCAQYHDRLEAQSKVMFAESTDSEEIASLKQNMLLYQKSVSANALSIAQLVTSDQPLKESVLMEMKEESTQQTLPRHWLRIVDTVNVFEAVMAYCFNFNWKYQQIESKKLFRLQTMAAKERRTLQFFVAKQRTERKERQYRLQSLYERLSSLQNKILRIKRETKHQRNSEQTQHVDWIGENVSRWTAERETAQRESLQLATAFEAIRDADSLAENTQLRRSMAKKNQLVLLETRYSESMQSKYAEYDRLKQQLATNQDKLHSVRDLYENIQCLQQKEAADRERRKLRGLWHCTAMLKISAVRARKRVNSMGTRKAKKAKKGKKGKKGKNGAKKKKEKGAKTKRKKKKK